MDKISHLLNLNTYKNKSIKPNNKKNLDIKINSKIILKPLLKDNLNITIKPNRIILKPISFFKDNEKTNQNKIILKPLLMIKNQNNSIKGKVMGIAKGTGYYPHNSKLEGGFVDKRDTKLRTLQDFLEGKADYVSIALDKNMYKDKTIKYGDKFRIPELEKKYNRKIIFKAVDTGGAFTNKRFSRVDICTRDSKDSIDKTINGKLTLIKTD